jgi:hypothetical protein
MQAAAKDVLMVDGRRPPGWFLAAKGSLEPEIADCNRLMAAYMANPSSAEVRDAARGARKAVRRAVEAARSSWVDSILAVVNADGTVNSADGKPISPQAVLHATRALRRGPRLVEEVWPLKLRTYQYGADPALCESTEENKKVMVENLKTVFSKVGEFDPAAVEEVPKRGVQPNLDRAPTVHEIRRAVMAMGNGKSGGDEKLPTEYCKALLGDQLLLGYLVEVMDVYWKSGSYPEFVATFTQSGPAITELTPAAKLAKVSSKGGESHGCKRTISALAVLVERATSATRGPLPSQLRYLQAALKRKLIGISSMAS